MTKGGIGGYERDECLKEESVAKIWICGLQRDVWLEEGWVAKRGMGA